MGSVLAIVDDEAVRRELTLAGAGLTHVIAFDRTAAADVVLVDASGAARPRIDLLRGELLQRDRAGPAIFLVPSLDDEVLELSAAHGPALFLLRPIAARELDAAIEVALHRARLARLRPQQERWHQATLRSIGDAVITADEDSLITFMNPTAQALTGWSENEARGKPLTEVFAVDNDDASGPVQLEPGAPVLRLRHRTGTFCTIEHNAAPIVEDTGGLLGVVLVFRDITERLRIDQRLALSGRMTSVSTLAAGIAHELNNPLAFVTSNLDFALGELEGIYADGRAAWARKGLEDSLTALREATDGAGRAARIIKDMKVFLRGEAAARVPVDVNRALSFAARLVRFAGELMLDLAPVPEILADEGQLVQVFVNLLTNAAQAIDPKQAYKQIRMSSTRELDRVVVRIEDSGCGIQPEHLPRVFEPFFTTKPIGQGLGLGLSISHTIVSSFGGTLAIESEGGRGTTVIVSLPVSEESRAPAPAPDAALGPRVLVIDDEALIVTAVRRILTRDGYVVVVENDAQRALERVRGGERFDVIVCDLMMPRFSGIDFYEGLASAELRSRVIFMTGNADSPRARALFEASKNMCMEKPFMPKELLGAIAELLQRHA